MIIFENLIHLELIINSKLIKLIQTKMLSSFSYVPYNILYVSHTGQI